MNNKVIKALQDIKRQIEVDGWSIPVNDRGSGSIGVRYIGDVNTDTIDGYLHFAETGNNSFAPQCYDIEYISRDEFGAVEKDVFWEIFYSCDFTDVNDILGFVVCKERYDMDYTFYITHIKD